VGPLVTKEFMENLRRFRCGSLSEVLKRSPRRSGPSCVFTFKGGQLSRKKEEKRVRESMLGSQFPP